jgi:hypothetical protein
MLNEGISVYCTGQYCIAQEGHARGRIPHYATSGASFNGGERDGTRVLAISPYFFDYIMIGVTLFF